MPELPDLEVFRVNIWNRLASKRLTGLDVHAPVKAPPQAFLRETLVGRDLLGIGRVGKELMFSFADDQVVSAHLMLSGEIAVVLADAVNRVNNKIFSLTCGGQAVVFSDWQGRCAVRYNPPTSLAPDALDTAFTREYFLGVARKKARTNIKAFLIDQNVVKGIGNAYADEILWAARVSPYSTVGKIPPDVMTALYGAIGAVLRDAVASIKAISPDRISGEERSFLKVHNKARKQTETGFPVKVEQVASKITYYTDEQVLYK